MIYKPFFTLFLGVVHLGSPSGGSPWTGGQSFVHGPQNTPEQIITFAAITLALVCFCTEHEAILGTPQAD